GVAASGACLEKPASGLERRGWPPARGPAYASVMETEVIAHRGASGTCPENTLPAFRRAVEVGAPMIELDVQLTRDGYPVVIHDRTLDRTTSGRGAVRRRTLAEIAALDAGR